MEASKSACRSVRLRITLRLICKCPFSVTPSAYFKALPFIVELRQKSGQAEESELETCFEALYGILLLRLQKKEISQGTAKAIEAISSFLSLLANYYDKERKGELKLDND